MLHCTLFPLLLLSFIHASSCSLQFFVSYHGGKASGVNNLDVYTINGSSLGPLIKDVKGLRELRGIAQIDDDTFLFANAYIGNSSILTTNCAGTQLSILTQKMISHPYGIAYNINTRMVYVTNQDTNNVVVFPYDTPALTTAFAKVDTPRGITVDPVRNFVLVASESAGVLVFNSTGYLRQTIVVDDPIGVAVGAGYLFVSSAGTDSVYSYNLTSGKQMTTYSSGGMKHPCGLVVNRGVLYVLGQKQTDMVAFMVSDGSYLGKVIKGFPDAPEQLVVASC